MQRVGEPETALGVVERAADRFGSSDGYAAQSAKPPQLPNDVLARQL